jgi:metal-responsive CopG/Arc/MetJ family transcriptional regulator
MMTRHDDAMRTIIDLPPEQLRALDAWREAHGVSRAEAVRQAIARLLEADDQRGEVFAKTRGLWAARDEDGLAYQERMRSEWDR